MGLWLGCGAVRGAGGAAPYCAGLGTCFRSGSWSEMDLWGVKYANAELRDHDVVTTVCARVPESMDEGLPGDGIDVAPPAVGGAGDTALVPAEKEDGSLKKPRPHEVLDGPGPQCIQQWYWAGPENTHTHNMKLNIGTQ